MKTILLSFFWIIISSNISSQNRTMEVEADIQFVTVYNSSAEIKYEKKVNLPKGKSTVAFTELTPFIVPNTVNLSVSESNVNILTVTEKINHVKFNRESNQRMLALHDSLKSIKRSLGMINPTTEALLKEKELLFKDESIGGVSNGVSVAEIEKASIFFNQRYTAINTMLFELKEKEERLIKLESAYQRQMSEISSNTGTPGSEISVTVFSPTQTEVVFSFKFLTNKGKWEPSYDFKFEGPEKPIQFVFRANVFNSSGVSWNNVDLKLSTASPTSGFETPTLEANQNRGNKTTIKNGVKFKEIEVNNTLSEYKIAHKYSIPSDSKPYLIDVDKREMKANFYYLLIPKLDPFGFLMASIPNWDQFDLIPGYSNIYSMGTYMGRTFVNTYPLNDTLNLFLGKDKHVVARRNEETTNSEQKIIGNFYVDKSEIIIEVQNNFDSPLNIRLLDQVPVIENNDKSKLSVHGIDNADYLESEGLLTWKFELAANESNSISFKYEIKTPKSNIEIGGYNRVRKVSYRTMSCPTF